VEGDENAMSGDALEIYLHKKEPDHHSQAYEERF
jgi:hypothetical protein